MRILYLSGCGCGSLDSPGIQQTSTILLIVSLEIVLLTQTFVLYLHHTCYASVSRLSVHFFSDVCFVNINILCTVSSAILVIARICISYGRA